MRIDCTAHSWKLISKNVFHLFKQHTKISENHIYKLRNMKYKQNYKCTQQPGDVEEKEQENMWISVWHFLITSVFIFLVYF